MRLWVVHHQGSCRRIASQRARPEDAGSVLASGCQLSAIKGPLRNPESTSGGSCIQMHYIIEISQAWNFHQQMLVYSTVPFLHLTTRRFQSVYFTILHYLILQNEIVIVGVFSNLRAIPILTPETNKKPEVNDEAGWLGPPSLPSRQRISTSNMQLGWFPILKRSCNINLSREGRRYDIPIMVPHDLPILDDDMWCWIHMTKN